MVDIVASAAPYGSIQLRSSTWEAISSILASLQGRYDVIRGPEMLTVAFGCRAAASQKEGEEGGIEGRVNV